MLMKVEVDRTSLSLLLDQTAEESVVFSDAVGTSVDDAVDRKLVVTDDG